MARTVRYDKHDGELRRVRTTVRIRRSGTRHGAIVAASREW